MLTYWYRRRSPTPEQLDEDTILESTRPYVEGDASDECEEEVEYSDLEKYYNKLPDEYELENEVQQDSGEDSGEDGDGDGDEGSSEDSGEDDESDDDLSSVELDG